MQTPIMLLLNPISPKVSMKDELLEKIKELLELSLKEIDICPYVSKLTSKDMVRELKGEVEEVEKALEDGEGLEEEVGDTFRDALLLLLILSKEKGIEAEEIIGKTLRKIRWRKPWLFEGRKVSLEEAKRIWRERKAKEKEGKGGSL